MKFCIKSIMSGDQVSSSYLGTGHDEILASIPFFASEEQLTNHDPIICESSNAEDQSSDTDDYFEDDLLSAGDHEELEITRSRHKTTWINVAPELVYVKCSQSDFYAKMTLESCSSSFVTYYVIPTNYEKFRINKRIGVIKPFGKTEVVITTISKEVKHFQDIVKEGFVVAATLVHFRSQLELKKLRLLWNVYGTDYFPLDVAEMHQVTKIIPATDSYMDDLCLIDKFFLSCYVTPFNIHCLKLPRTVVRRDAVAHSLFPNEPLDDVETVVRAQVEEVKESLKKLQGDTTIFRNFSKGMFYCIFILLFQFLLVRIFETHGRYSKSFF